MYCAALFEPSILLWVVSTAPGTWREIGETGGIVPGNDPVAREASLVWLFRSATFCSVACFPVFATLRPDPLPF